MYFIRGLVVQDHIDGWICGVNVRRELDDRLGDVWCALLLGDENVAGWRGPLQAE